jgi:hypothetical protein
LIILEAVHVASFAPQDIHFQESNKLKALRFVALLGIAQVDIITEGDHVNEVYILVAGQAIGERGSSIATTGHPEGLLLADDGATSVHGGSTRCLGPGDTVGEMAFFTETPCMEVRLAGSEPVGTQCSMFCDGLSLCQCHAPHTSVSLLY